MLINDLSQLTTIPEAYLEKLTKKVEVCLCDQALEQVLAGEEIIKIDIGIGDILLKLYDEEIKYKFIPSERFKKELTSVVVNKENLLAKTLEKNLAVKITKTYKDLL